MKHRWTLQAFAILCVSYVTFTVLFLSDTTTYHLITREDQLVENLGFVFLFLTSVFLGWAGVRTWKNPDVPRVQALALFFMALIFFWAAGEEISWGQRIFSIPTPESLARINAQKELNLHNIDKTFFDRVMHLANVFFAVFAAGFYFSGRDRFAGFKLPDVPLVLTLILVPLYKRYDDFKLGFYQIAYVILAAYLVDGVRKRERRTVWLGIITLVFAVGLAWVHQSFADLFPPGNNSTNEIQETMLCFAFMAYSVLLWRDARGN